MSKQKKSSNGSGQVTGFELPRDFCLPTMAEIEEILALGDRSWTSLKRQAPASTGGDVSPDERMRSPK